MSSIVETEHRVDNLLERARNTNRSRTSSINATAVSVEPKIDAKCSAERRYCATKFYCIWPSARATWASDSKPVIACKLSYLRNGRRLGSMNSRQLFA
jgi:hypothetical protein